MARTLIVIRTCTQRHSHFIHTFTQLFLHVCAWFAHGQMWRAALCPPVLQAGSCRSCWTGPPRVMLTPVLVLPLLPTRLDNNSPPSHKARPEQDRNNFLTKVRFSSTAYFFLLFCMNKCLKMGFTHDNCFDNKTKEKILRCRILQTIRRYFFPQLPPMRLIIRCAKCMVKICRNAVVNQNLSNDACFAMTQIDNVLPLRNSLLPVTQCHLFPDWSV